MILRRITQHVKDQNWFAVGLDFFIVVMGVFFGIQIGNWNDSRLDNHAYEKAYDRMVLEAQTNINIAQDSVERFSPDLDNFRDAIEDIRSCRNDVEASARVNEAVQILSGTFAVQLHNSAMSQLTTSERLLERQSTEQIEQFARYARNLNTTISWSGKVLDKMENRSDDLHPFIDYGPFRETSDADRNGRVLMLTVPLEEACQDHEFRKMFYQWEGGHSYQTDLFRTFVEVTQDYLKDLGEETALPDTIVQNSRRGETQ